MKVQLEFLSPYRSVLGVTYMQGTETFGEECTRMRFYEICIGFVFVNLLITFYKKGE